MAAPRSTYDLLWSHQLTLMHSIDSLHTQISTSENTFLKCQESLTHDGLPRHKKKKLQWSRATAQKNISMCKQDVSGLLNELAATQERIGEAHQQIAGSLAGGFNYNNHNNGYSNGFGGYEQQQQRGIYAYRTQQPPQPQSEISPLSIGPQIWDLSRIPSTSGTPISGPLSPSHNNNNSASFSRLATVSESQSQSTGGRGRSKDSGSHERVLFAHPFDIGSTTERETEQHLFAHERMITTADSNSTTTTTAATATDSNTSDTKPAILNPRAQEFTFDITAAVAASTTPDGKLKVDSNLSPTATSFTPLPSSPYPSSSAEKHQRRYSEAAITIIENHLEEKEKKQQQRQRQKTHDLSETTIKNNDDDDLEKNERKIGDDVEGLGARRRRRIKRRGKNVEDVVVDMWYSGPRGIEIVEEMVWPLTA